MSAKFAQDTTISCPKCKQEFRFKLWLLLDEFELPQLFDQILSNSIHDFSCPYCCHCVRLDAPLLLFRRDQNPPLLFSPAQSTTKEQNEQHFQGLIWHFQQQALGAGRDPEGKIPCVIIPRPYLPTALNAGIEVAFSLIEQDLKRDNTQTTHIQLLSQFIEIESWSESKAFLYQHSKLLDKEALDLLQTLIQDAQQQQDEKGERALCEHLALLKRCREGGIEAAYQEKGELSWPEEIAESVSKALQAQALYERTGELVSLHLTVALWNKVLTSSLVQSLQLEQQLVLLNRSATGFIYWYRVAGDARFLNRAIENLQGAVNLTPSGPDRASYLSNLGNGLRERYARVGQLEDQEAAIRSYQEALDLTPSGPNRAVYLNSLGIGLLDRYASVGQMEDLDACIRCYQEALNLTPSGPDRASYLSNLGNGLRERYARVGQLEDQEAAIRSYQEALDLTPSGPDRASYLSNLGNGLFNRYASVGQLEDLDACIRCYQEALNLTSSGPNRAIYLNNLGSGLNLRYICTGRLEDQDAAIRCIQEALDFTPLGPNRAMYLNNLSSALQDRYYRTGQLEDMEVFIRCWQEAVDLTPSGPERARYLNNLGSGLHDRFDRTGQLKNLVSAVFFIQEAVDLTPSGPNRASYVNNLGNLLHARYHHTDSLEVLEASIHYLQEALNLTPSGPDRANYLNSLSNGLRDRYRRTGRLEDQEASIHYLQEALNLTPSGPYRASCLNNLGNGLSDRYTRSGQLEDLEAAIRCFQEALDLTPSGPNRASCLNNLGNGLCDRYRRTSRLEDLEMAIQNYRQACQIGQEIKPDVVLKASRSWGTWALERTNWTEAVEALSYGLDMINQLYRLQATRAEKEAWLREGQELPTYLAYAMVQCNKLQEAVEAIENGSGRLLAEALTDKSISPDQLEIKSLPPRGISFDHICQAASSDTPLVYLLATPIGGQALIVTVNQKVIPLHLPQLTTETLRERISGLVKGPEFGGFLGAYTRWRRSPSEKTTIAAWQEELGNISSWLWQVGIGQLVKTLKSMEIDQVVIIPSGFLGLLPLHAARQDCVGPSRYALDEICFRYAPNAQSLLSKINSPQRPGTLLVIDNPDRSLLFSADEVEAAVSHFAPDCLLLLKQADATIQNVLNAMPNYEVLHFSTHGMAGFARPLNGSLLLAEKQELTLLEVMQLDLAAVRLVVLSACETGIPGTNLPDEVISLPTGFLQAGAAGVVGSLWAVNDLSTMLLMRRFYELWLGKGMQPWEALREAQIWLRSRTKEQWQDLFEPFTRMSKDVAHEGLRRAKWDEIDFSHPFYWAAFGYFGQ